MRKPLTAAITFFLFVLLAAPLSAAQTIQRLLTVDDINSIREVEDPRLSPDGEWVAHTVRTANLDHMQRYVDWYGKYLK